MILINLILLLIILLIVLYFGTKVNNDNKIEKKKTKYFQINLKKKKHIIKDNIPETQYQKLITSTNICPLSSYKQCTNNFNSYNKLKNTLTYEKPGIYDRVNIWNYCSN